MIDMLFHDILITYHNEMEVSMVIDVHYHQMLTVSDEFINSILGDAIRYSKIVHKRVDLGILFQKAKEIWPDPDGEKLLAGMDESGVDFTVICGVDDFHIKENTSEIVRLQNKTVAHIAQNHPDRLIALAGVDPRRDNAVDMLRESIEEIGMKGIKYNQDFGYDLMGPEYYKY